MPLMHDKDPRALRAGRDTGPARLPAIPQPNTGNAHLDTVLTAIKERLEVREGTRGNDAERVVTQRELKNVLDAADKLADQVDALSTAVAGSAGPLTPDEAVKRFQDSIRRLKLYQDLMKSLNDPTRFDDLRAEVREELLRDLTAEAQRLGANILQTQKLIQDTNLSLAMQISQLTASVQNAASGVRQTQFATAELGRTQAGIVNQLKASLGDYYNDGSPGSASLEEVLLATADRLQGLSAQYTLKVQAGGALAGFGLSATEVNGVPSSAFIINAEKFAIVSPNYAGGLTNMPATSSIPFGVDASGIYMNSNVYLSGTMRIQGGDKTLIQGLRGSLQVNAGTGAWSDAAASTKIWTTLGNAGSPPNTNHLVIGDMVTMGNVTRYWNGSAWSNPGMVISGDLLVDGTVAATKVNTNGLTIRDANGNVIFDAGAGLNLTQRIPGLGSLATASNVTLGNNSTTGNVRFADGTSVRANKLVSDLSMIDASTIGTFIATAAIGGAYIGNASIGNAHIVNAAVDTLKIGGGSVTSMRYGSGGVAAIAGAAGAETRLCYLAGVTLAAGSTGVVLTGSCTAVSTTSGQGAAYRLSVRRNGAQIAVGSFASTQGGQWSSNAITCFDNPGAGTFTYELWGVCGQEFGNGGWHGVSVDSSALTAVGGQR